MGVTPSNLVRTAVSEEPAAYILKWYAHLSSPAMDAAGFTDIWYLHIKHHNIIKLGQSQTQAETFNRKEVLTQQSNFWNPVPVGSY